MAGHIERMTDRRMEWQMERLLDGRLARLYEGETEENVLINKIDIHRSEESISIWQCIQEMMIMGCKIR